MPGVTIEKPKTPDDLLPIHLKKSDVSIEAAPSFQDAAGKLARALVDADHHVQVDVLSMPSVEVLPSFQDAAGTPQRALVDADKHAQVDVLTAANPSNLDTPLSTRASESTLGAVRDRLPPSLTASGNLKTAIQEDAVGLVKSSQLPSSLTASGNLKAAVVEDAVGLAKSSDLSAVQPRNLTQIAGTALTGRDWSGDFAKLQNLDTALSILKDNLNLLKVNGITLTGADWTQYFAKLQNLDTALSQAINNLNLLKVNGTTLTGADWTQYFSALPTIRDRINELSGVLASTTTALGANASYTSGSFTVSGYGRIVGSCYADQAGTLYVEQSSDGTNFDVQSTFSYSAGALLGFSVEVVAPTARVRYVNGATAQTVFRLYVRARRI